MKFTILYTVEAYLLKADIVHDKVFIASFSKHWKRNCTVVKWLESMTYI